MSRHRKTGDNSQHSIHPGLEKTSGASGAVAGLGLANALIHKSDRSKLGASSSVVELPDPSPPSGAITSSPAQPTADAAPAMQQFDVMRRTPVSRQDPDRPRDSGVEGT